MSNQDPYGRPPQPPPGPGSPPPIPQYPSQSPPQGPGQPGYPGQQQQGPPPAGQQPQGQQWNQQPGPASFGAGIPPAQASPPAKRRRIWLWLLAIPVLFALLIGGCSLALFLAVTPAVDATNDYVALLDEGNYGAAYDSICARARQATDRDTFIADAPLRIGGEITDYRFSNVNRTNNVAEVSGSVSVDGVSRTVNYDLVQEDGEWRVCGGGF